MGSLGSRVLVRLVRTLRRRTSRSTRLSISRADYISRSRPWAHRLRDTRLFRPALCHRCRGCLDLRLSGWCTRHNTADRNPSATAAFLLPASGIQTCTANAAPRPRLQCCVALHIRLVEADSRAAAAPRLPSDGIEPRRSVAAAAVGAGRVGLSRRRPLLKSIAVAGKLRTVLRRHRATRRPPVCRRYVRRRHPILCLPPAYCPWVLCRHRAFRRSGGPGGCRSILRCHRVVSLPPACRHPVRYCPVLIRLHRGGDLRRTGSRSAAWCLWSPSIGQTSDLPPRRLLELPQPGCLRGVLILWCWWWCECSPKACSRRWRESILWWRRARRRGQSFGWRSGRYGHLRATLL